MPAALLLPLVTQILRIIEQAQIAVNNAPPEYRENYFRRLDKWESFWEKLAEPFYKLVVRESEQSDTETKKSN